MGDFGIPLAELKKVGMTDTRLAEMRFRMAFSMEVPKPRGNGRPAGN